MVQQIASGWLMPWGRLWNYELVLGMVFLFHDFLQNCGEAFGPYVCRFVVP